MVHQDHAVTIIIKHLFMQNKMPSNSALTMTEIIDTKFTFLDTVAMDVLKKLTAATLVPNFLKNIIIKTKFIPLMRIKNVSQLLSKIPKSLSHTKLNITTNNHSFLNLILYPFYN